MNEAGNVAVMNEAAPEFPEAAAVAEPADPDAEIAISAEPTKPAKRTISDEILRDALKGFSRRLADLRSAFLIADEARKDAKKAWESEQSALEAYLRRLDSPQAELPLSDPGDNPKPTAELDAGDEWRLLLISELERYGLAPNITAALLAAKIETFGDLADFTGPSGDRQLEDVKGIGEAKAEAIREAFAAYWKVWGQDQQAKLNAAVVEAVEKVEAERCPIGERADVPEELATFATEAVERETRKAGRKSRQKAG